MTHLKSDLQYAGSCYITSVYVLKQGSLETRLHSHLLTVCSQTWKECMVTLHLQQEQCIVSPFIQTIQVCDIPHVQRVYLPSIGGDLSLFYQIETVNQNSVLCKLCMLSIVQASFCIASTQKEYMKHFIRFTIHPMR